VILPAAQSRTNGWRAERDRRCGSGLHRLQHDAGGIEPVLELRQGLDGEPDRHLVRRPFCRLVAQDLLLQHLDLDLGIAPAERQEVQGLEILQDDLVPKLLVLRQGNVFRPGDFLQARDLLQAERRYRLRELFD